MQAIEMTQRGFSPCHQSMHPAHLGMYLFYQVKCEFEHNDPLLCFSKRFAIMLQSYINHSS